MIQYKVGNLLDEIENYQINGLMNAANCRGPMGRGIAGAIKRAGGNSIQFDAFSVCRVLNPKPGQAYSTTSGSLKQRGIKRIIHAGTMAQPGGITSYEVVECAFNAALDLAKKEKITKIGCTALGTGVGGLDSMEVGRIMAAIAKEEKDIDIVFIDFDEKFIEEVGKNL